MRLKQHLALYIFVSCAPEVANTLKHSWFFLPEAGVTRSLYPPNFPLGAFHEIWILSWDNTLYLNLVGGGTEKEKQSCLNVEAFKLSLSNWKAKLT